MVQMEIHKYLGPVFDSKLCFQPDVDSVSEKGSTVFVFLEKNELIWCEHYNDDFVL